MALPSRRYSYWKLKMFCPRCQRHRGVKNVAFDDQLFRTLFFISSIPEYPLKTRHAEVKTDDSAVTMTRRRIFAHVNIFTKSKNMQQILQPVNKGPRWVRMMKKRRQKISWHCSFRLPYFHSLPRVCRRGGGRGGWVMSLHISGKFSVQLTELPETEKSSR